jgi:hypothetical protein
VPRAPGTPLILVFLAPAGRHGESEHWSLCGTLWCPDQHHVVSESCKTLSHGLWCPELAALVSHQHHNGNSHHILGASVAEHINLVPITCCAGHMTSCKLSNTPQLADCNSPLCRRAVLQDTNPFHRLHPDHGVSTDYALVTH